MKSWRTTVAGIFAAFGAWASNQAEPWWLYKVGPLLTALGLVFLGASARDNNVPSAAIPKAAAAEEKIKRDTAFTQK